MDKIVTSENQSGAEQNVPAADVTEAEASVELHTLLNAELNKQFPDAKTALKSVKDTFSFSGKAANIVPKWEALVTKLGGESKLLETMDNILSQDGTAQQPSPQPVQQPAVDTSNFVTRAELDAQNYFNAHPELASFRSAIELAQKATGKPIAEVVDDPAIKPLIERAVAGEQIEKSKSVMQTNSRLGAVSDKFTQAKEAAVAGNVAQGAALVTEAVVEAFGLGK